MLANIDRFRNRRYFEQLGLERFNPVSRFERVELVSRLGNLSGPGVVLKNHKPKRTPRGPVWLMLIGLIGPLRCIRPRKVSSEYFKASIEKILL